MKKEYDSRIVTLIDCIANYYARTNFSDAGDEWKQKVGLPLDSAVPSEINELVTQAFIQSLKKFTLSQDSKES